MNLHDEKIYLIDGARSAIGNYGGSLALTRPDDLAAALIRELAARHHAIRDDIDEVILGCANQAGEDNRNIARMALLLAGLDQRVPGITVNRLCASGLDAVIYGAARIRSGASDLVLVGGVESMSRAPYVLAKGESAFDKSQQLHDSTLGWRFVNPRMAEQYGCDPLGITAENVAREHGVSREAQDAFALRSQQRAAAAIARGRFAREIVPLEVKIDRKRVDRFAQDEFPRATSLEKLAALKPAFQSGGTVTAGNASGINDGGAVLLLASGAYAKRRGLQPLAEIGPAAAAGVAPSVMGIGPIASTERLLARTGFALSDFDLFEINEAFASQVLATLRHWRVADDDARVNPNGGAIALGHPLGMSGARLALTAALELAERQARHALVTMCVGVGQGVSLILKSV